MKVDLPGSNWASLAEPAEVPERRRRPFVNLQRRLIGSGVGEVLVSLQSTEGKELDDAATLAAIRPVIGDDDFGLVEELNDQLIVTLVTEWSFDAPITIDSVLDLPGNIRTALVAHCEPLVGALVGETPDADVLDPTSPTAPGSG